MANPFRKSQLGPTTCRCCSCCWRRGSGRCCRCRRSCWHRGSSRCSRAAHSPHICFTFPRNNVPTPVVIHSTTGRSQPSPCFCRPRVVVADIADPAHLVAPNVSLVSCPTNKAGIFIEDSIHRALHRTEVIIKRHRPIRSHPENALSRIDALVFSDGICVSRLNLLGYQHGRALHCTKHVDLHFPLAGSGRAIPSAYGLHANCRFASAYGRAYDQLAGSMFAARLGYHGWLP